PRVCRVDIQTLAVLSDHFPTLQVRFPRIVTRHQRFEMRIPVTQEISSALLHPALEVTLRDLVWKIETRMIGFEYRHRRQLVGHAKRPRFGLRKRREITA